MGSLKVKIYSCETCGEYSSTNSKYYKRHLKRCQIRQCKLCDFEAFTIKKLQQHQSSAHGKAKTKTKTNRLLQCGHCEYRTSDTHSLKRHSVLHQEKRYRYQCPHCDLLYLRIHSLYRHIKIAHTQQERNWHFCSKDGCDYKTLQLSHLKRHYSTVHSTHREYECPVCEKTYKLREHLHRHMKTDHSGSSPSDQRKFQCDFCEYRAKTEGLLESHLMIHTGVKPFTCDICNLSFRQRSTLQQHRYTHTGERPYKCAVCDATFRQHSSLYTHRKSHLQS